MKVRKLTVEEKKTILTINKSTLIDTINARKDYINHIIVDWIFEKGVKNTWLALYTQYGKSYVNKLYFDTLSQKMSHNPVICAVYPEIRIKEDADKFNPSFVQNFVINSAKAKFTGTADVLFIDELQYALNPETARHNVFDITHLWLLGNAAFLDKEQINVLESKGINYCFEIDEVEGLKLGLVPDFTCINIPVELTPKERANYYSIELQYKECIDFIYPVFEKKSQAMMFVLIKDKKLRESTAKQLQAMGISITESQLMGKVLKYLKLVRERMELLKNGDNKYALAIELVKKHKDQKGIIFVNNLEAASRMCKLLGKSSVVYSSKTGEKPLISFREGEYNQIIVVGKANVGYISAELEYSINLSYEAKPLKARQRKGRIQSVDPNNVGKMPVNYFFYVPDFSVFGVDLESQEKKWLKTCQKDWLFISYKTKEEVLSC